MLVNDVSTATKTIDQYKLSNGFTHQYTIDAATIVMNNIYVIYFGNDNFLSSFSAASCLNEYNETIYNCTDCPI